MGLRYNMEPMFIGFEAAVHRWSNVRQQGSWESGFQDGNKTYIGLAEFGASLGLTLGAHFGG
jgi:hypothetical protein